MKESHTMCTPVILCPSLGAFQQFMTCKLKIAQQEACGCTWANFATHCSTLNSPEEQSMMHDQDDEPEAHLGACVHGAEFGVGSRVPEPDAAICSSTPGSEKAMLMRRPCYGLHCRSVLGKLHGRAASVQRPDAELVVVAA